MIDAEMYGMMPRPKIVTWLSWLALNMATVCSMSPMPPLWLLNGFDRRLVDDRQRNLKADAIDGQHHQRQQDLRAAARESAR